MENINYKINFGNETFYVPMIETFSMSFLELLKDLREHKKEIEIMSQDAADSFSSCLLIQFHINFDCHLFNTCGRCIFKPHVIKAIGMGNFFKFLTLSKHCRKHKDKTLNYITNKPQIL